MTVMQVRNKVPYSQKYWRELNLVVCSQTGITKILADFNLAVQYGIAIHTYARAEEILADFNLAVVKWDRQTAKFSSYTVQ